MSMIHVKFHAARFGDFASAHGEHLFLLAAQEEGYEQHDERLPALMALRPSLARTTAAGRVSDADVGMEGIRGGASSEANVTPQKGILSDGRCLCSYVLLSNSSPRENRNKFLS